MTPISVGDVERISLESDNWSRGDIAVATTFGSRLRGVRAPGVNSLLLETSSVHSFGMMFSLRLVSLDAEMRVLENRTLPPNRLAYLRGARFVLELPLGEDFPEEGARLAVRRG